MANQYRHIYSAQFINIPFATEEGDTDIWELTTGNYPISIIEMRLGQMAHDSSDTKTPIRITLGTATATGSGGATATVRNLRGSRSSSTAVVAEYMNDVEATGIVRYVSTVWNILDEFLYQPVPEARLTIAAGEIFVARLANPSYSIPSIGLCSTIIFAEFK